MKECRKRRLKEKQEIERDSIPMESEDLFHTNMLDNYYKNRPDSLERMCLQDLNSKYDYKKSPCNKSHEDCCQLKNNFGYFP